MIRWRFLQSELEEPLVQPVGSIGVGVGRERGRKARPFATLCRAFPCAA